MSSLIGGPRRRFAWFAGLACVLSWAWLIPLAVTGAVVEPGRGWPTHFPALLGPALAAVVVTAWAGGRRGLLDLARRATRVRVPARWWVFAVSPVLLAPGALVIAGDPLPPLGDFAVISGLPAGWGLLGVAVVVVLVNGFGEETGWRGFAVHTLQDRYSALVSTVMVAAAWAVWHVPMFFVLASFQEFSTVTLVGWLVGLFCGAIVLTWLFNRSGGSIAVVAVWHGAYNIVSATRGAEGVLAAVFTTMVVALAVILVVVEIRATRRGTMSIIGPRTGSEQHTSEDPTSAGSWL